MEQEHKYAQNLPRVEIESFDLVAGHLPQALRLLRKANHDWLAPKESQEGFYSILIGKFSIDFDSPIADFSKMSFGNVKSVARELLFLILGRRNQQKPNCAVGFAFIPANTRCLHDPTWILWENQKGPEEEATR